MKTDTRKKILEFIKEKGTASPNDIKIHFGLSGPAIHKQLRKLEQDYSVQKIGKSPRVFYLATDEVIQEV